MVSVTSVVKKQKKFPNYSNFLCETKRQSAALAPTNQLAQLVGAVSRTPKVSGSIPGQGTYLGFRSIWEATNQCFFLTSMVLFLSLSRSPHHSLKSINISSGEDKKKRRKSAESKIDWRFEIKEYLKQTMKRTR